MGMFLTGERREMLLQYSRLALEPKLLLPSISCFEQDTPAPSSDWNRAMTDSDIPPVDPESPTGVTWNTRPLFVSSTFTDMHDERDELRIHTFAPLEERLRERRHYLETIDLRLGVETGGESDEAEREMKVLRVCLDEIKRSRPFFIGLIGDRYGWTPPAERMTAAARNAGFHAGVAGKSVTELEIIYGVLENPDQAARSWFYLRELDYGDMPADLRKRFDDRLADDPGAQERVKNLDALKTRLRQCPFLAGRVRVCRARWKSDPAHPQGGAVTGWEGERPAADASGGLETVSLAQAVQDDLWSDLDPETRTWLRDAPRIWQEADARLLDDFVADRVRGFVEREAVTTPLLDHALSPVTKDAPWGLCLVGPAGSGKSSVFGWVYRDLQERQLACEPVCLLAHAAGIHPHSGSVDSLLRRWIHELAGHLDIPDPVEAAEAKQAEHRAAAGGGRAGALGQDDDAVDVEQTFAALLHQAARQARVVLLIDALNQFERSTRAQYITWLPKVWPENARFLATAIPGIETETLAGKPCIAVLPLPALSVAEAGQVALRFYERYHREPNPRALATLLAKTLPDGSPACGNPLWLELALQEMNLLEADDYARAQRDFAALPDAQRMEALQVREAEQLPPDPVGVYGELLTRAERDFGEAFTRAVVNLIVLGRAGWREIDLAALVPMVAVGTAWDELAFAGVRRTLGHHLVQRGAHGQWDGFHAQFREAVMARNLAEESERKRLHDQIANHLEELPKSDLLRESELMEHYIGSSAQFKAACLLASDSITENELSHAIRALANRFTKDPEDCRESGRAWICGLLTQSGLSDENINEIAHHFVFQLADELSMRWNISYRKTIIRAAKDAQERLLIKAAVPVGWILDYAHTIEKIASLEMMEGDSKKASENLRDCLRRIEQVIDATQQNGALDNRVRLYIFRSLSVAYERLGHVSEAMGDLAEAENWFQKSRENWLFMIEEDPLNREYKFGVIVPLERLACLFIDRGDHKAAQSCIVESIEIIRTLLEGESDNAKFLHGLSVSLERIGDIELGRGNAQGALAHYSESSSLREKISQLDPLNSEFKDHLAIALRKLGEAAIETGDLKLAISSLSKSRDISEFLVKNDSANTKWQRGLSISFDRLGLFAMKIGDLKSAESHFKCALKISVHLASIDPENIIWWRDLISSHQRLAFLARENRDLPGFKDGLWNCFNVLNEMSERRLPLDRQLKEFHKQLRKLL